MASTAAEWLPLKVLEYSILKYCSSAVEVRGIYTLGRNYKLPLVLDNRPRTPFSFQRFLIPEFCGYAGKAIYLDSDMQVFSDIGSLWSQSFDSHDLLTVKEAGKGRVGQFSVMLLDCERLRWNIDEIVDLLDSGKLNYSELMYEMKVAKNIGATIPKEWNDLERFDEGKTCLLHYTDMETQPWVSSLNPLGHLWVKCLREAIHSNFITIEDMQREIANGHVRPSLMTQIQENIDDSIKLTKKQIAIDANFIAPYKSMQKNHKSPWTSFFARGRTFITKCYYKSSISRLIRRLSSK